jgi:hypothetical protein
MRYVVSRFALACLLSATILASPAMATHPAPAGLAVAGMTESSVSLAWDDYTHFVPAQYRVCRYPGLTGSVIDCRLTGSTVSVFTWEGLLAESTWGFAVQAQQPSGHRSQPSSRVLATTSPPSPPVPAVWITPAEVDALPTTGQAFDNVKAAADTDISTWKTFEDNNLNHDTYTLAAALMWVRLDQASYRTKVLDELKRAEGTECLPQDGGSLHLNIARGMTAYVVAAELIDLPNLDPTFDAVFRAWIEDMRESPCNNVGEGMEACQEGRTNNHGTQCAASRAAISAYLDDDADLAETAQFSRVWMGDRSAFAWPIDKFHGGLSGSGTWMPDTSQPRPINPVGSVVGGKNVDGAQPQEQSRCGAFRWPSCYTAYPWGGVSGGLITAEILRRNGYPNQLGEQSSAIKRAFDFLHRLAFVDPASAVWWDEAQNGDDAWLVFVANKRYGTTYPTFVPVGPKPGRNLGWGEWTHAN